MNRVVWCSVLLALVLAACSTIPSAGPLRDALIDQADTPGPKKFDVIKIDGRVVDTLLAQPRQQFRERFKKYDPPPELPIAIGDLVAVSVWESAADGLYGRSIAAQAPTAQEIAKQMQDSGIPVPANALLPGGVAVLVARLQKTAKGQQLLQSIEPTGRIGTRIPDQEVGPDGAISIPYGGRIRIAGLSPRGVQQLVEKRLSGKAIDPQALVLVKHSDVNVVTVSGELIDGARVPLSPGGTRLLTVIATAGGARAPVDDTYVKLSRNGVTAAIPLATLVAEPDENIFVRPGDVLTLVRKPQVVSVFGATGKNQVVTFDADRISLSEALAKSAGLSDDQADPRAVFLLRYENAAIVKALGEPVGPGAGDGMAPVAYRLDLADALSYALAQRFPVRDKDVIYVAAAKVTPLEKVLSVFSNLTEPVISAYLLCRSGATKC